MTTKQIENLKIMLRMLNSRITTVKRQKKSLNALLWRARWLKVKLIFFTIIR